MDPHQDQDYCFKNDCSAVDVNGSDGFIATSIRPVLKSFSSSFRSFMPYPISDFDDTGALVFVFFIITLISYFISWLFSDSGIVCFVIYIISYIQTCFLGRPDVLDRRALHDALTKIKEQEVQIEQLRRNASDPAIVAQYQKEIERLRNEKSEVESRLAAMGQAYVFLNVLKYYNLTIEF